MRSTPDAFGVTGGLASTSLMDGGLKVSMGCHIWLARRALDDRRYARFQVELANLQHPGWSCRPEAMGPSEDAGQHMQLAGESEARGGATIVASVLR